MDTYSVHIPNYAKPYRGERLNQHQNLSTQSNKPFVNQWVAINVRNNNTMRRKY